MTNIDYVSNKDRLQNQHHVSYMDFIVRQLLIYDANSEYLFLSFINKTFLHFFKSHIKSSIWVLRTLISNGIR